MEKLSGTVKALRVNARNQRNWSREKSMQLLLITCILNVVNEFTKLLDFRWGKDVLVDNFISRHLYLIIWYIMIRIKLFSIIIDYQFNSFVGIKD